MHTDESSLSRTDLAAEKVLGKVLDERFRIDALVGSGAMGNVFRATHLQMHATRAVKVLHPWLMTDSKSCQRFLQEARTISNLDHPNVVKVYACGQSNGVVYIAMDFLEGESLSDAIELKKKFDVAEATEIIIQAARGLANAHQNNVVHRDVKPSNIMLCESSGGRLVKVVDFGVAKILETDASTGGQHLTGTGAAIGTPYYMSPEQCQNAQLDARADIYSLGCVLFQLVTGKLPVEGESVFAAMYAHIQGNVAPLPEDLPTWMQEVIAKCLATHRDDRYQSMNELITALETRTAGNTSPAKLKRKPAAGGINAMLIGGVLGSGALVVLLYTATSTVWKSFETAQELKELQEEIREQYVIASRFSHRPHKSWEVNHKLLTLRSRVLKLSKPNDQGESASKLLFDYQELASIPQIGREVPLLFEAAEIDGLSDHQRHDTIESALKKSFEINDKAISAGNYALAARYNALALPAIGALDISVRSADVRKYFWKRLHSISQTYMHIRQYSKAEESLSQWLRQMDPVDAQTVYRAHALALLSKAKRMTGQIEQSIALEQQSLQSIESIVAGRKGLPPEELQIAAQICNMVAQGELARQDYESSLKHNRQSAELAGRDSRLTHSRAEALLSIGICLQAKGDLTGAMNEYSKARSIWDGAPVGADGGAKIAQVYKIQGDLCLSTKKYQRALTNFRAGEKAALASSKPESRNFWFVSNVVGQAATLTAEGETDQAIKVLAKADSVEKCAEMQALYCEQKGHLSSLKGDVRQSAEFFRRVAVARHEQNADPDVQCASCLRASDALFLAKNVSQGSYYLGEALRYAKLSTDKTWLVEVQKRLPR